MNLPVIPGVRLIGLGYKCRQGKGRAAQAIVEKWPTLFKEYAFADALRAVCRAEKGMTVKDGILLQTVGQAARDANPDVWVEALYWRLDEERPQFAVISDVRYPNECEFIRSQGGILINCVRKLADGRQYISPDRDPSHISENLLNDYPWDYTVIGRDGHVEAFAQEVVSLVGRQVMTHG